MPCGFRAKTSCASCSARRFVSLKRVDGGYRTDAAINGSLAHFYDTDPADAYAQALLAMVTTTQLTRHLTEAGTAVVACGWTAVSVGPAEPRTACNGIGSQSGRLRASYRASYSALSSSNAASRAGCPRGSRPEASA